MSGISTNLSVGNVSLKSEQIKVQAKPATTEEKKVEIKSDNVNVSVKKGIVPTLKGVGIGAAAGGTATVAALQISMKGKAFAGEEGLASIPVVGIGLAAGAIVGGVTANLTNNKTKGTIGGAIAGAAVTAGITAKTSGGNLKAIAIGAGLGALVGAAGGFTGSLVAKTK